MTVAGHCAEQANETWAHGTQSLGPVRGIADGGPADVAIIRIDNYDPYWRAYGHTYVNDLNKKVEIHAVTGSPSQIAEGDWICKSGITSDQVCGAVERRYAGYGAGGVQYTSMLRIDACTQKGNSGGPAYRVGSTSQTAVTTTIVGTHSGGTLRSGCSTGDGGNSYQMHIKVLTDEFPGLSVDQQ